MLTDLVEINVKKCHKYWPDVGKAMKLGKKEDAVGLLSISTETESIFAPYTKRQMVLTHQSESSDGYVEDSVRKVKQLHFHGWSDQGIPN